MSKLFDKSMSQTSWEQKYIHPGTLISDPELIIKEEGTDIYSFPLFTELFCKRLIEHAEEKAVWTVARHNFYPTTDCLLSTIDVETFYRFALEKYVIPIVQHVWRYTWTAKELVAENFIARYTPESQSSLATHNDEAWFSMVVSLNEDFKGGGTAFPRQNLQLHAPTGYAAIHPGRLTHPHGGLATVEGKRYIAVSFMKGQAGTNQ